VGGWAARGFVCVSSSKSCLRLNWKDGWTYVVDVDDVTEAGLVLARLGHAHLVRPRLDHIKPERQTDIL
jgi:hypothetical protein